MRFHIVCLFLLLFAAPLVVGAEYVPLTPIPGVTNDPSLPQFIQAIIKIVISVGAILAVLMIVIGGFQWMVSEAVGDKEQGKERIRNAILGLLILLGSFLILNTINPRLTNLSLVVGELKLPTAEETQKMLSADKNGLAGPEKISFTTREDVQAAYKAGTIADTTHVCAERSTLEGAWNILISGDYQAFICFRRDTPEGKRMEEIFSAKREADPSISTPNKPYTLTYCSRPTDPDIFSRGTDPCKDPNTSIYQRFYKTLGECEADKRKEMDTVVTKRRVLVDCSPYTGL